MKNIKLKGAILITTLFIATFLSLIIAGVYPMIRANITMSADNINHSKLYYATESGSNYGLKWIRNLDDDDFNNLEDAKTVASAFNTTNTSLSINNMSVNMSVEVDTTQGYTMWKIISIATNPANNQKCMITLDSLRGVTALEYSYFSAFTGKLGGYFTPNQNFYGKCYFNGEIAMQHSGGKMPTFWGEVDSHYASKSIITHNYFLDPILEQFNYGLKVANYDSGFDKHVLLDALVNDAFPYGYNKLVQEQNISSFTHSWSEMLSMPKTLDVDDISFFSTGEKVEVHFDYLLADVAGSGEPAGYYIKISDGSNIKYIRQDGTYDIIAIPSKFGNVHVKGVVDQDISVITEKDKVYLEGDFYSTKLQSYIGMGHESFDNYSLSNSTHPVNQLKSSYRDIHNIGLIVGLDATSQTHLYVNRNLDTNQDSDPSDGLGADIILCSAAIYCPKGRLYAVTPSTWSVYTKFVMFGGFIGDSEGSTESGNSGFSPNYINNPNFLTGDRPPGFKDAAENDPNSNNMEHRFSNQLKWTLEWL